MILEHTVTGKWFEIVVCSNAQGFSIQLLSIDLDDSCIWLPDDPKKAAEVLREAARFLEGDEVKKTFIDPQNAHTRKLSTLDVLDDFLTYLPDQEIPCDCGQPKSECPYRLY